MIKKSKGIKYILRHLSLQSLLVDPFGSLSRARSERMTLQKPIIGGVFATLAGCPLRGEVPRQLLFGLIFGFGVRVKVGFSNIAWSDFLLACRPL